MHVCMHTGTRRQHTHKTRIFQIYKHIFTFFKYTNTHFYTQAKQNHKYTHNCSCPSTPPTHTHTHTLTGRGRGDRRACVCVIFPPALLEQKHLRRVFDHKLCGNKPPKLFFASQPGPAAQLACFFLLACVVAAAAVAAAARRHHQGCAHSQQTFSVNSP